jgi:hypothetical protein
MDKVIYVTAAAVAIAATLVALLRPAAFIAHYTRAANAIGWLGVWGILWVEMRSGSTLRLIVLEFDHPASNVAPDLQWLRTLATEAVALRRSYLPAFLAVVVAAAYVQVLGKVRAKAAQEKAV